ncbi:MAG: PIG-L family deacetylase [Thermodesulfobacteriota bacterium]
MKTVIADIKRYWQDRPFLWSGKQYFPAGYVRLPISGRVLVLAPHPDDPESVAITCRLLAQSGCEIWYAVVSLSPAGVEDEYARKWDFGGSLSLKEIKGRIRRREQIRSAEMFGLSSNRIAFLGIAEERNLDSHENIDRIKDHLDSIAPDLVILPAGKDSNRTHAWVNRTFRMCATALTIKKRKSIVGLYNEDPKTLEIRKDLFVLFNEEDARWKGNLLKNHDSQQQRNLRSRKIGFDERILRMNHESWRQLCETAFLAGQPDRYAEAFEIELFDEVNKINRSIPC